MKKILLTEAQNKLVEAYKAEKALLENVERTVGGYEVRKLIKEGDEITGEYRNWLGQWHTTTWNAEGKIDSPKNAFEAAIYKLPLNEGK